MGQRLHVSGKGSTGIPKGAVLVCDRITEIQAQKGSSSNWPYDYFVHKFTKKHGQIYRLDGRMSIPSGAQLIYDRVESIRGNKYYKTFKSGKVYGLKDGRIMITSSGCKLVVVAPYPLWDVFNYE